MLKTLSRKYNLHILYITIMSTLQTRRNFICTLLKTCNSWSTIPIDPSGHRPLCRIMKSNIWWPHAKVPRRSSRLSLNSPRQPSKDIRDIQWNNKMSCLFCGIARSKHLCTIIQGYIHVFGSTAFVKEHETRNFPVQLTHVKYSQCARNGNAMSSIYTHMRIHAISKDVDIWFVCHRKRGE